MSYPKNNKFSLSNNKKKDLFENRNILDNKSSLKNYFNEYIPHLSRSDVYSTDQTDIGVLAELNQK